MKIGVFGDSYADKGYLAHEQAPIWYNMLKHLGHAVDCWGEGGSSILFSADLIEQHASNYDIAIWCLTTPGRFSLPHKIGDRTVHVTTAWDHCSNRDPEVQKKHAVCIEYLKYLFEWDTENFVGKSVVYYLQSRHSNLMIVPCFPMPLHSQFNLYHLCEWEAQHYFPGQTIPKIYETHMDLRPGHITAENQKILALLISQDLKPGVFQTSYDNFVIPVQSFHDSFQLKS